ncbi:hypothetical protein [Brevibacillus borstelensis]|uniref:hypothetical protein n=1 Tax=Brevibacillus borstelensis TaxID=45462 RepID=UPI002E1C8833|nr:hypothetical protein [Brevibacillus borstelensis]
MDESYVCDCPDPVDYSVELRDLISKLDASNQKLDRLLEHQAVMQEIALYSLSALAVLVGAAVLFGFWLGWRAAK